MDPRDSLKKNVSILNLLFLISNMKENIARLRCGREMEIPNTADGVLGR